MSMGGDRQERPEQAHSEAAAQYVKEILHSRESQRCGHGIEDAVHHLVELRPAVHAHEDGGKFETFLDRADDGRAEYRGGRERSSQ